MTVYYVAGWEAEGWTFDISGAYTASAVEIPDGTYSHLPLTSTFGNGNYTSFGEAFETALNSGGRSGFVVTWSPDTNRYTIFRSGSNFGITFNSTAMRVALGYGSNLSGDTSYTSTKLPTYLIQATIGGRSQTSGVYEPDDIVHESVADDGTSYSMAHDTSELHSDWMQMFETKAKTFIASADSEHPWTYEQMFKHCRMDHPFVCYDSNDETYTVHKFRADGAAFNSSTRMRQSVDYDALWNINLRTRYLGFATVASGIVATGNTLSVIPGGFAGTSPYTYQWRRDGSNIGSATSSTYTVTLSDIGPLIDCVVTATNGVVAVSNTLTYDPLDHDPTIFYKGGESLSTSLWSNLGTARNGDMYQPVAGSRPTLTTIDDIDVPDFEARYFYADAQIGTAIHTTALTIVWMCRPDTYVANLPLSYLNDILFTDGPQYIWIYGKNSATPGIGAGIWDGVEKKIDPISAPTGTPYVCHLTHDGSTLSLTVGTNTSTVNAGPIQSLSATMYMGYGASAGSFRGVVADFVAFNRVLTAGELADLRAYIKYRFPSATG